MNTERLLDLADRVENSTKWDLKWHNTCFMGHAYKMEHHTSTGDFNSEEFAHWAGISWYDAFALCFPADTHDENGLNPYDSTATQAALVLRKFVQTGTVDWHSVMSEPAILGGFAGDPVSV